MAHPPVAAAPKADSRPFLSPAEFGGLTGLSLSTVRRYIASKQLQTVQIVPRGRVLIPVEELQRYLPRSIDERPRTLPAEITTRSTPRRPAWKIRKR